MPFVTCGSQRLIVELPACELKHADSPGPESLATTGAAPGWATTLVNASTSEHPWDQAHRVLNDPTRIGFESNAEPPRYIEPDLIQRVPYSFPTDGGFESFSGKPCEDQGPRAFWPVGTPSIGWHLDDDHSQLKSARDYVRQSGTSRLLRAAILDTGYDPTHEARPETVLAELGWNFVDGRVDATDPGRFFPGNQPGHGTATMALLAGRRVKLPNGFDDYLGGAPDAQVVPIRIADSVIHFYTSAMANGIRHAVANGCRVVSISMGGLPARSWAAAINAAYEAGVAIFAAAGNRIGPSPPMAIVYPARFKRVTAVCGVTADGSPYYRSGLHREMQGCFGPPAKMNTAIAAYTPNAPWALMGCTSGVGFGGGTSSATPQVAAAAILWLQHVPEPPGIQPWQRVEAVRNALFISANATAPDNFRFFGNGTLKSRAALDQPFRTNLPKTTLDEVSFPWLRSLDLFEADTDGREKMFEVEALQAYMSTPSLQELVDGADPTADPIGPTARLRLLDSFSRSPLISQALREKLREQVKAG